MAEVAEPIRPTRSRRRRLSTGWNVVTIVLYPVIVFVVVMTVWELWVRLAGVSQYVLPPPSDIARELNTFSEVWPDLWVTVQRALKGFALAVVVGFFLALGIVTFRPVSRALYPLLISTQVIPKVAVAPLFLVWFGYGGVSTILIVFLLAFFPVVINTTLGLRSTEQEKLYLARSIGASWLQTFVKIRLPNALPSIFGGLKLAALLAVNGAVVAEFLSATTGIGRILQSAAGDVDLVRMFVAIGYLAVAGIVFYVVIDGAERLAIPWHVSQRQPQGTSGQSA